MARNYLRIIIGVLLLLTMSNLGADETCNCNTYPFVPAPPCFQICYIGAASKGTEQALVEILGINEELAKKIANLDELSVSLLTFGTIWQQNGLMGTTIAAGGGENLGRLVGYYRSPLSNEINFAIQNTNLNAILGVPVSNAVLDNREEIMIQPHAPVYFNVDQPTITGRVVDIQELPSWTPSQLSEEELNILAESMKKLTVEQFNVLTNE